MYHRFSTWWRALSVVLLGLATTTWPSAAGAATSSNFSVVRQSSVATISPTGDARFAMTLAFDQPDHNLTVAVALYPRVIMRSQIDPVITGAGVSGSAIASTGSTRADCTASRTATVIIGLFSNRAIRSRTRCGPLPQLRLPCHGSACDGVYPIRVAVDLGGTTTIEWSLLALQSSVVVNPLRLNWITTLGTGTWAERVRTAAVLSDIGAHPSFPITLSANYQTLDHAYGSGTAGRTWRTSFSRAAASPLHRIANAPPSEIDFAGLAANGLDAELKVQLGLAGQLVQSMTGRYLDGPVLLEGSPSAATLAALSSAGVANVVLPEDRLTVIPSTTLTWGAPFRVTGGESIVALADDEPLSQLAVDGSIEPGRRAAITLATLAFLHFEAPNAPSSRTVIVMVPAAATSIPYLNDIIAGLRGNPFVVAGSLAPSFSSSLIASDGAPATRTLETGPTSTWSAHNVSSLGTLATQVDSFGQAITDRAVSYALGVAAASSEIVGSATKRQYAINAAAAVLNAQLAQFTVDPSAITLAGPGTALPITLHSTAPYTVTAVVHLITNQLVFPKGPNIVVSWSSPTTSIRVPTSNRRGNSLTLQVNVTTSDQRVLLAHAAIQVRIAGSSVVGYLLTAASLLVLAAWWWRTHRRRPKARHAR